MRKKTTRKKVNPSYLKDRDFPLSRKVFKGRDKNDFLHVRFPSIIETALSKLDDLELNAIGIAVDTLISLALENAVKEGL